MPETRKDIQGWCIPMHVRRHTDIHIDTHTEGEGKRERERLECIHVRWELNTNLAQCIMLLGIEPRIYCMLGRGVDN